MLPGGGAIDPGAVFGGRFEIEHAAASGGMGTVYRAIDRVAGGRVALKVLHSQDEDDRTRFSREASLLAEVAHPAIVSYVAHGATAAGNAWMAMEWLDGEDLASALARRVPSMTESVELAIRVARALSVLHALGIVHRDVKPQNIFLEDGDLGRAKLLDLGIARAGRRTTLTSSGAMVGTPGYMAPEQAAGGVEIDARADVFALGCVMHECLTGRAAFTGEHAVAILAKVLLEDAVRLHSLLPGAPAALDDVLGRMLAKDPMERPPDAAAVVTELEALGDLTELEDHSGPRSVAPHRPPSLTETEQRMISVVMAGAASPTARTMSPRESRGWEEPLRAAAAAHGARVDWLVEGSLLATLGGAGAATDQAARAARCALALRPLLRDAPVVLATGRAVVEGRGGRIHLPLGEVIDRAAALLRTAPPAGAAGRAGIRIDDATAGLLDPRFDVRGDDVGLVLEGERDDVESARTLLGKATPCVGRDRPLAALEALLDECLQEPVARVALVTGGAGQGKSRLRHELVRRLRARNAPVEILIGRADALRAGSPFVLLAHAIQRAAGISAGEPLVVRQRKLRARLARHLDASILDRVTVFVGELIGAPYPEHAHEALRAARGEPTSMHDAQRRAFEEWLRAECSGDRAVLLVLEDLHWGDLPSLRLVDHALRNLHDRPLMVLGLARPEVEERFPALWEEREVQPITLGALTQSASERLVREVLGSEVAEETVRSVVERAGGNAFYLEELIRAVAAGDARDFPPTVLAMAQVRLDALDPDARRVLRAASIFGKRFWRGGLLALVGAEEQHHVDDWLEELTRREVFARRASTALPGEPEYAFRHDLLREAAYGMLTEADRVLGHRLAGGWLESAGESSAHVLAEHYDRGRDPTRALGWWLRSAVAALDGNDFAAVLDRSERGVACGATGVTLGALRRLQSDALRWQGDRALGQERAFEAAGLLEEGTEDWYAAVAGTAFFGQGGLPPRAASLLEQAARVAPARGAEWAQLVVLSHAATTLIIAGRVDLAEPLIRRSEELGIVPQWLTPRSEGAFRLMRAVRARAAGDSERFLEELSRSLDVTSKASLERAAATIRSNLAVAQADLGFYAEAEGNVRVALVTANRLGMTSTGAMSIHVLATIQLATGRLADARATLDQLERVHTPARTVRLTGVMHLDRARLELSLGELDRAEREARTAIDVLAVTPPTRVGALAVLARVLARRGVGDEALRHAEEASRGVDEGGDADGWEALVRLAHVEALDAAGRRAEAGALLGRTLGRLEERAQRFRDPANRRSFLERVPENAQLRALAETWGIAAVAP